MVSLNKAMMCFLKKKKHTIFGTLILPGTKVGCTVGRETNLRICHLGTPKELRLHKMDAWKTPHIGPWKNSCDLGMAVTDLTWRYITTMVLSSQPQKWSGVHPPDWRKTTNLGGVASSLLLLILQIILCTLKWRIAIRYTIKNCLLGAKWSPKHFMFPFRIPW